jgi:KTSC domain
VPRKPSEDWWRSQGYSQEPGTSGPPATPEQDFNEGVEDSGLTGAPAQIPFTVYPTSTSNILRPRTIAAGYDKDSQTLRLRFRPGASSQSPAGAIYDYYGVTPTEWKDIRRVVSVGKFINRRLSGKEYDRIE